MCNRLQCSIAADVGKLWASENNCHRKRVRNIIEKISGVSTKMVHGTYC